MKTVAFIVARKGSKRIPNKNVKRMCGKPLFSWCMDAALGAKLVDEVWIATDDPVIEAYAEGDMDTRIFRTREMDDDCIQETIINDFLMVSDFETLVLMQATSPLVTADDIDGGITMHREEGLDAVASIVEKTYLTYSFDNPEFQADPWPLKGEISPLLIGNGAFWIISREEFERSGSRIGTLTVGLYEMPEDTLYEVDTETDWVVVETLLERRLHAD